MSRPPTAKTIFLRARALPAAERLSAVRASCAGDDALEREVLELLEIDDALGDESDKSLLRDVLVGRELGGYHIEARIGSGSMGAVYVATQKDPDRRVALKLLRSVASTPIVRRRFQNESDLLARLSHPNIARVLTAGTLDIDGDAVPFFAMELVVDALPITTYADQHDLSFSARLELLATACDAVQHGHQRGVIHRDLKPDNILVDRDGVPKLIDFGIARVIDTGTLLGTLQTAPGQLIGTLTYMCPEQCSGSADALDIRGDVYSLGVVLFELVAGRPPLDLSSDSWVEALNRITREEPQPPSRFAPRVPRAVDAIAAKALAKQRERRYDSAAELANDLRAAVAGKPIRARRPGPLQRSASWVAEHPLAATVALCVLLILTVTVSLWSLASYYAMTPATLVHDPTARIVRLEARNGATLFDWATNPPPSDARLVSLGSGTRLALFEYEPRHPNSPLAGHVGLYAIDPPSREPLWTTAVELGPFEAQMHANPQWILTTVLAQELDVFSELPGVELLVLQRLAPGDFMAIRVFDAAGELRYATYHRGVIDSATIVRDSDRVVLAGLNSEHTWAARGQRCGDYPVVVFALDPVDGHRGPDAGLVAGREVKDATVAWYRWLGPVDVLGEALSLRGTVNLAIGRGESGSFEFKVAEATNDPVPWILVSWVVDAAGEMRHCYPYDVYKTSRLSGFPPIAEARLQPLEELPEPR